MQRAREDERGATGHTRRDTLISAPQLDLAPSFLRPHEIDLDTEWNNKHRLFSNLLVTVRFTETEKERQTRRILTSHHANLVARAERARGRYNAHAQADATGARVATATLGKQNGGTPTKLGREVKKPAYQENKQALSSPIVL